MSHFLCVVITPPGQEAEAAVELLLAPYDENIEVTPRPEPCYCVKDGKPVPGCYECRGSGEMTTTYNPKSRWDWYQIGGRWSGVFQPDYDPEQDPRNQESCPLCRGTGHRKDLIWYRAEDGGVTAERPSPDATPVPWCNGCSGTGNRVMWPTQWVPSPGNLSRVRDLSDGFVPYAVVTPDGEWHEKGYMGWFAISTDEDPSWDCTVAKIFATYPDHIAVAVDCHI